MASTTWAAATALTILAILLLPGPPGTQASLPPITCDGSTGTAGDSSCTLLNSYREWPDRKPCRVGRVVYPKTEAELVAAVAAAVKSGTKIKLVSKQSHSFPKLACPGSSEGTLVSTRDLDSTIRVDHKARTVTVDAGVQLRDLVAALAAQGLAFPYTPYWHELSVSGMLASGAHGSSMWGKGSAMHEYVTAVRVVVPATKAEGYAKVRTVTAEANPRELAAWKVHLGVLGAVSQVTLQVQPQFKRSLTFEVAGDEDIEERLLRVAEEQEFGDVSWYPAQKLVRYRLDNRAPVSTPGDGVFENFTPLPVAAVEAFRAQDLAIDATRNAPAQCARSAATLQTSIAAGFGTANNRSNSSVFQGYPVVGYNQWIQASGACSSGPQDTQNPLNPSNLVCLWDLGSKGAFFFNNAVALPISKMKHFIRDVKRLVALRPLALCDLENYNGIVMRFVRGNSSAYLGKPEDVVDMDFTFKRNGDGRTPSLDMDVHAEVEQMALFKYGGSPHWAKCRPLAFAGAAAKFPRLRDFLAVKAEVDPQGLFGNEWTDAVLGLRGRVTTSRPFCALEGLCVCSKDEHCAPKAGYFCRPGLVYKRARVCRFEGVKRSS